MFSSHNKVLVTRARAERARGFLQREKESVCSNESYKKSTEVCRYSHRLGVGGSHFTASSLCIGPFGGARRPRVVSRALRGERARENPREPSLLRRSAAET